MEQLQYHQQIEFGKTSKSDGELEMKREVGSDFSVLRNGIRERKGFDVMMEGIAEGKKIICIVEWREVE